MCDNCCGCKNHCGGFETPEYLELGKVYQLIEDKVLKGKVFMVGYNQVGDPVVHYADNEFMQCFATNADCLKRI